MLERLKLVDSIRAGYLDSLLVGFYDFGNDDIVDFECLDVVCERIGIHWYHRWSLTARGGECPLLDSLFHPNYFFL